MEARGEEAPEALPPAEELLAVDGAERESRKCCFSFGGETTSRLSIPQDMAQ